MSRPANMFYVSGADDAFWLPNPDTESAENIIATFVDSGRDANAQVIAQKLGRDQVSTQMAWNYLEKEVWERMIKFWNRNFFFTFQYYDRVYAARINRQFYIGDRHDRPFSIDAYGVPTAYVDCTANVIDTGRI